MTTHASFEQILLRKMSGETAPKQAPQANPEPAHLAFLMGQIPVYRFRTNARPKENAQTAQTKLNDQTVLPNETMSKVQTTHDQAPAAPAARKVTQPHVLNDRQKTAMLFFEEQNEALFPDFTADELKKAYRKLAKKLHPDATKSTDATEFINLKFQAKQLSSVLN